MDLVQQEVQKKNTLAFLIPAGIIAILIVIIVYQLFLNKPKTMQSTNMPQTPAEEGEFSMEVPGPKGDGERGVREFRTR